MDKSYFNQLKHYEDDDEDEYNWLRMIAKASSFGNFDMLKDWMSVNKTYKTLK